jgi:hypothetical protein
MASPPYDPTIAEIPQVPTHFLLRDIVTGNMLITAPLPVASFQSAFNLLEGNSSDSAYIGATVIVEFLNVITPSNRRVLFGVPVDVAAGGYVSPN